MTIDHSDQSFCDRRILPYRQLGLAEECASQKNHQGMRNPLIDQFIEKLVDFGARSLRKIFDERQKEADAFPDNWTMNRGFHSCEQHRIKENDDIMLS